MIHFRYPELFLLALPLLWLFRRYGYVSGVTGWLRAGIVVVLLLAMTGPLVNLGGYGVDVIVVADRSRSLTEESHQNIQELIDNLQRNRGPGDRIGIVTFGGESQIEQTLSETAALTEYAKPVSPDGSDLGGGLALALNMVDADRPTRLFVLSDGEYNGSPPLSAARRAREERIPIDIRAFERQSIGDAAVESVLLPESVATREPFQFSTQIYSDRDRPGDIRVLRDGVEIAKQHHDLHSGLNRLLFRDLLETPGLYTYTVELDVTQDPIAENNRGAGVVRVESGPRILMLTSDGAEGNLARELRSANIPVDIAIAVNHPVTLDSLDPYRAVIIENVPANDLGRVKMERLAQFVEDLGGGLMLTGGERSFGTGGYFKSPLDEVLPVSMELREDHRKNRVALAVALDRSGSMAVSVKGDTTKMDLANLGTAECIRMLSSSDKIAVIAVDSSPHVVQPLAQVNDPQQIIPNVLKIQSEGGGIFVYDALVAAGTELAKAADYQTRHIILFSDAADSEEPGAYKTLLSQFAASNITVSVIGLGTPADVDAKLLEEIASLGQGNIMFTDDPQELPRLFAQDTMSVARNMFIRKTETQPTGIPGELLAADARLMGDFGMSAFPNVDGYNLSYLKPDATAAVISQDEYQAPWSAFWYWGLGRVSALTMEVDGAYSGQFGAWDRYDDFLITHARWLLGRGEPEDVFSTLAANGQQGVMTIELDPERPAGGSIPRLVVIPPGEERVEPLEPDIVWTGPHTIEARFRMERTGTYRTLIKFGNEQFSRGPAVTLPYSPEFVPRVGLPSGRDTLLEIAQISGGEERTDVLRVFNAPTRSARMVPILPWLMGTGIVLLLLEIAGRRLSLWVGVDKPEEDPAGERPRASWLPRWKPPVRKNRRRRAKGQIAASTVDERELSRPAEDAPDSKPSSTTGDVFEQAKRRAQRRMK